MPQLILEYSGNVDCPENFPELFNQLHCVLADTCGINPENCKSRARAAETFFVGSGSESDAFVHLDIKIFEGRTPQVKQAVGKKSLGILEDWFHKSMKELNLQITVEIMDINRDFYFKR